MVKVIHKKDLCIGCGTCVAICPELFELSEKDYRAVLKNAPEKNGEYELEVEEKSCVKEAADVCPVACILLKED